jgi:hypothetical protein
MEDVSKGLESCPIPLQSTPVEAINSLDASFKYITKWILPKGVQNELRLEDDADAGCNCNENLCDSSSIECTCVIDYGNHQELQNAGHNSSR